MKPIEAVLVRRLGELRAMGLRYPPATPIEELAPLWARTLTDAGITDSQAVCVDSACRRLAAICTDFPTPARLVSEIRQAMGEERRKSASGVDYSTRPRTAEEKARARATLAECRAMLRGMNAALPYDPTRRSQ